MAKSYEIAFKLNAKMNSAFSNTFKKAEQIAKGLGNSVENTASKMSSVLKNNNSNISKMSSVLEKNPAMNKVSASLNKMGETSMKSANKLQSGYTKAFRTIENNASNTANKIITTFGAITATVLGAGAISDAVETYKGFEQSMANTAAVAGVDVGSEAYKALEKAALDAGKATSKTAQESADALSYMSLAGWSAETSIKGLMPILRASEATQADLATTSDLVTDSMSALGLNVDELNRYLDVAAKTNNKSNQTLIQLMEAYTACGGSFKDFGTDITESSALLGTLANRGIKGAEAGHKLNAVLINLTAKSGQSYEAMKKLGIAAYDQQGKFKGVTKVLEELHQKTEKLTDEQKNNYYSMIGGKTQKDTLNALLAGITTPTESGEIELYALRKELENSTGALDEMATTINGTMTGAFARLNSAVDDFKINMVKQLAPVITPAIDKVASTIPKITTAITENLSGVGETLGQVFGSDIGSDVFDGIKSGLSKVAGVIDTVKSAFKEIQSAYSESFGKILPEIKPLISDIFSSFNNIETDKMEIFNQAFKSFKDIVIEAAPIISFGIKLAITEVSNIAGTVSNVLTKLTPYINSAITVLQSMASAALNVASFIIANWSSIRPIAIGIASAIGMIKMVKFATDIGKATKAFALLKIAKVKDKVETLVLNGLYAKDAVVKGISTAATWAQTAAVTAWNVVSGIATIATTALGAAFTFLTSPIGLVIIAIGLVVAAGVLLYQNWETVKAYALQLWENIVSVFNNIKESVLNAINSLAEKFPGAFELITTYFDDWKENINTVIESVKTIFNNVIEFVKNVFTGKWEDAWENVKNIFSSAFNALEALATAPLNAIISLANKVIDKLNSISIPKDIPFFGGWGFNLNHIDLVGDGDKSPAQPHYPTANSQLNGYATGCNYTEDTFIAGEEGPEIITNRAGSKVYDAIQTNRILNRVDSMYSSRSHGLSSVTPLRTSSNVNQTPINIQYSPQISIQGNIDDNSLEELKQALKVNSEEVRQIVMNTISEIEERGIRKSND